MAVRSSHDIGSGVVDGGVDGERGAVERPRGGTTDDLTVRVDEDQIVGGYVLEVHAERVDPEEVVIAGVTNRYVTGDTLIEAESAEDAEGQGEALFAAQPL